MWKKLNAIWAKVQWWKKKEEAPPALEPPVPQTIKYHLVGSSGGERAIRAMLGVVLAVFQAGLELGTIGGVSGGAVPAILIRQLGILATLRLSLELDSSQMLTPHYGYVGMLLACLKEGRWHKRRPRHGLWHSEKLGEFIDKHVPEWPKGFWCLAIDELGNALLLDETGVRQIMPDGSSVVVSSTPTSPGLAIRATCAAPCGISPVQFGGRHLFDGDLSPFGGCPVPVPEHHYGAKRDTIIACDAGNETCPTTLRMIKLLKLLGGERWFQRYEDQVTTEGGLILVRPTPRLASFEFNLTRDEKWRAMMDAYIAAVEALEQAGKMTGQALADAKQIAKEYREIEITCEDTEPGTLSRMTEQLMERFNLY
jgi:predicted acylesterase/phospholipase RssA